MRPVISSETSRRSGKSELRAEPLQLAAAGPTGRHLGTQIPDHLFGVTHVAADQIEQHLVRLARIVEPQHRNDQAFLEDLFRQTGALTSADIDMVDRIHRKPDQLALMEGRRRDEDIRRLPVAEPRVVANEDVTRIDGLGRKSLDKVGAEGRHAARVARSAKPRLRHQAPVVEQARRHVVHFDHVVAEGGPKHGCGHLVRNRDQARPNDVERQFGVTKGHCLKLLPM